MDNNKALEKAALCLSEHFDADLVVYAGPIDQAHARYMIEECRADNKRPNAYLVLLTYGGDPHAAYRIGRCLQRNYKNVVACAPGPCASAGTLLVLAANELVMSDLGLLGPLDIQLRKTDELFEMTSGLTVTEAIVTLRLEAWSMFQQTLLDLKTGSRGQITLRTALETAASLTTGLFEPLFAQIDPMRLGEDGRSTRIIAEYGNRLNRKGGNLKPEALHKLVAGYPSHLFEIDREEAQDTLFTTVRAPDDVERDLIQALGANVSPDATVVMRFSAPRTANSKEGKLEGTDNTTDSNRASAKAGAPNRGKATGSVPKTRSSSGGSPHQEAPLN